MKRLVIRADASAVIGTGHVMRSLTLASEAAVRGWFVCFAIRNPSGSIIKLLQSAGHQVRVLSLEKQNSSDKVDSLAHGNWLSVSQKTDAGETLSIIQDFKPDWIIVDHYALDANWHRIVKPYCANIMVIDDLADRSLDCKILLDQNVGAREAAYKGKVLSDCKYLMGPEYALLRKEFQDWRQYSLNRRLRGSIQKILITMGGVDASNHTLEVIKELERSEYSADCEFTIVLGALYSHKNALKKFIESSQLALSVMINVKNMAEIMAKSDLCIGAAGSTSWERCCLGLPTLTLAIAENQKMIALALDQKGAAISSSINQLRGDFEIFFESNNNTLDKLTLNSKAVCDGLGVSRVIDHMEYLNEN